MTTDGNPTGTQATLQFFSKEEVDNLRGGDAPTRSEEEDWQANREELVKANEKRDWFEVLRILVYLSNKDGIPEAYKAMAQAAWLVLKIQAPVTQVTLIFYNLLVSLTPKHRAGPAIASLANLMSRHRTPDHPDRELAINQAGQMLHYVATTLDLDDQDAFQAFVEREHLNDPDHFLPLVMETLDAMIRGDWWFDHHLVQEELERDATRQSA
ncbi:MAG: hypothetical protein G8345_13870 [Magnetococcales bacterium]|nr:hypothetical protein [Magnetococcales bacterium]